MKWDNPQDNGLWCVETNKRKLPLTPTQWLKQR